MPPLPAQVDLPAWSLALLPLPVDLAWRYVRTTDPQQPRGRVAVRLFLPLMNDPPGRQNRRHDLLTREGSCQPSRQTTGSRAAFARLCGDQGKLWSSDASQLPPCVSRRSEQRWPLNHEDDRPLGSTRPMRHAARHEDPLTRLEVCGLLPPTPTVGTLCLCESRRPSGLPI